MTTMTAIETQPEQTFHIERRIDIKAPPQVAFEALLAELGPASEMPDGTPFPMTIEPWPGGRWFRDLGGNAGHFWGHVQVIKPPTLLEICGPLFMSYAAINHVQYRLAAEGPTGGSTQLTLIHRAIGQIAAEHREGVSTGWDFRLNRVRELAEAHKLARA